MNINYYFNTKFDTYATRKSNQQYLKLTVMLDDFKTMFSVLTVVETGKVMIQSFNDVFYEHLYGLTDTNHFSENTFVNTVLPKIDKVEVRAGFERCLNHLDRSFKNHANKMKMDSAQQVEVYKDMRSFKSRMHNALNTVGTPVDKKDVSPIKQDSDNIQWKEVSDLLSSLSPDELNQIVEAFNDKNAESFALNGRVYRINNDGGNRAKLEYYESDNSNANVVTANVSKSVEQIKRRKQIEMAYMKNNINLEDIFENGHFYSVINRERDYVTLLGDDNENHRVNSQRIELLKVYDEAPEMIEG